MGEKYLFVLPMAVVLPRKRKEDRRVILNANNAALKDHYFYNSVKEIFKPVYVPPGWPETQPEKIRIRYFVQRMTRAKFDTMNYVSYVDKFFLDWLQTKGMIPNDYFFNVCYGGIDGRNQCKKSRILAEVEILHTEGLQIKP